jgi:hypothetical protein
MWQTVNITSPEAGFATRGPTAPSRRLTSERGIIKTMATDRAPHRAFPGLYATATWG